MGHATASCPIPGLDCSSRARPATGRRGVVDAGVAELRAGADRDRVPAAGQARAGRYRARYPCRMPRRRDSRPTPPNALSTAERWHLLELRKGPRFADKSVAQAWATGAGRGVYLASMATMHLVLGAAGQAGERRRQATHPPRTRPE